MTSERIKFSVGLFLICGLTLIIVGLIWLGANKYFKKGYLVVSYFNESVQGLNIDSPVKFRGVAVGRVKDIKVAPDSRLIAVIMDIEPSFTIVRDNIKRLVASLKNIGITGSMFIELDLKTKDCEKYALDLNFEPKYPVIPSKPGELTQIVEGINAVLDQINTIQFEPIFSTIQEILDTANKELKGAQISKISEDLQSILRRANAILQNPSWDNILHNVDGASNSLKATFDLLNKDLEKLDHLIATTSKIMEENRPDIKTSVTNLKETIISTKGMIKKGEKILDNGNSSLIQIQRHLAVISQNLQRATANLDRLIEELTIQPSRLLFSSPPKPRSLKD